MTGIQFSPALLESCTLCPRQCGVDRSVGVKGYCRIDGGFGLASITLHRGEEPVLSGGLGICNVFFGHCNLRCLYCQNVQISRNETEVKYGDWSLAQVVDRICAILDTGVERLGFVSPSGLNGWDSFLPRIWLCRW